MGSKPTVWLAATKLAAPARRHDALPRPRLINLLAKSLADARLTLISAPAGSGRTALLAGLPHAFRETAWGRLLLHSQDDEPSRFTAAHIASLNAAGLPIEADAAGPDTRAVITSVINQIGKCSRSVAVVLDDVHVISEPSVHEII